ncbi:MAG: DUF4097 family beta strand repeat-containing protein [Candidatus Babeliales bacterium]
MKQIYIVGFFLFFLPACDWLDKKSMHGRHKHEVVTITHNVSDRAMLTLNAIDGSILVKGVDSPTVTIKATKFGLPEDIQQLTISSHLSHEAVVITTEDMRIKTFMGIKYPLNLHNIYSHVDYEVELPRTNSLYIRNKRGDISLQNLDGDLHLFVDRGDVAIVGCKGVIDLGIDHGNIKATDIINTFSATIDQGKIDIRVKELPQRRGPFLSVDINNGDISVGLPKNPNAFILAASKGSIHSEFPLHLQTSWIRRSKSIKGVLGKGGPEIDLRAKRGTIEIQK